MISGDTETKIIRYNVAEYEELQYTVNRFMGGVNVLTVQYEISGGYIFAFITYVGENF